MNSPLDHGTFCEVIGPMSEDHWLCPHGFGIWIKPRSEVTITKCHLGNWTSAIDVNHAPLRYGIRFRRWLRGQGRR